MDSKKFFEKALKKFGNKIYVDKLSISENDAKKLEYKKEDIENYPEQAWIPLTKDKGYLCPTCNKELGGLFGVFFVSTATETLTRAKSYIINIYDN